MRLFALILCLMGSPLTAEEASVPAVVREVAPGKLEIGKIQLDQKTREIRIPAGLNMDEGLLEYVLVLTKGKVHESLFLTDISPIQLNVALKLLRYQESLELFPVMNENYEFTGKYHEVPEAQRKAARLDIHVHWMLDGKEHKHPLNQLIQHAETGNPLAGPWLNTGSYMHEGKFKAEVAGDIIAIFTAQPAMINYPGKDRQNDEVWIPNKKLLPPLGTPVTLIIRPTS